MFSLRSYRIDIGHYINKLTSESKSRQQSVHYIMLVLCVLIKARWFRCSFGRPLDAVFVMYLFKQSVAASVSVFKVNDCPRTLSFLFPVC